MKIAIGITTKGREHYLKRALENHKRFLPEGAQIFVVDDLKENVGIPKAKNRCLELAEEWGADHIFLFDDDIWPVVENWHTKYVESPEAHLSYCWPDILPGPYGQAHYFSIGRILYEDDQLVSFSHPRGQMLYIDAKKVLPRIGGFDPIYGRGMVEHVDWSWRIHNAGLSTWKNQDVPGSNELFYSIDEHANDEPDFVTTIDNEMRTIIDKQNQAILFTKGNSSEYIEYRNHIPGRETDNENNVVICGVFTGKPDFQIGGQPRNLTLESVKTLKESCEKHNQKLVVLNNISGRTDNKTEFILTGTSDDPYKNRFLKALHYLIEHEEIDNAWIVDSGDVTMLNNPFPEMQKDKIYVGSETRNKLGCQWMINHTPNEYYRSWINLNANKTLLNCGLIGGSRKNLIEYTTRMFYIWGYNVHNLDLIDMLTFNVVGYEHFADRIIFGPIVNNEFRSMKPSDRATEWWLHK